MIYYDLDKDRVIDTKITMEGQECRKCGTAVIKRQSRKTKLKKGQVYYYKWYLYCPECKTIYFVDEGRKFVTIDEERKRRREK